MISLALHQTVVRHKAYGVMHIVFGKELEEVFIVCFLNFVRRLAIDELYVQTVHKTKV